MNRKFLPWQGSSSNPFSMVATWLKYLQENESYIHQENQKSCTKNKLSRLNLLDFHTCPKTVARGGYSCEIQQQNVFFFKIIFSLCPEMLRYSIWNLIKVPVNLFLESTDEVTRIKIRNKLGFWYMMNCTESLVSFGHDLVLFFNKLVPNSHCIVKKFWLTTKHRRITQKL